MNKQQRTRLAALKASTGELLDWTASAEGPNAQVYAIEVSPGPLQGRHRWLLLLGQRLEQARLRDGSPERLHR